MWFYTYRHKNRSSIVSVERSNVVAVWSNFSKRFQVDIGSIDKLALNLFVKAKRHPGFQQFDSRQNYTAVCDLGRNGPEVESITDVLMKPS